MEIKNINFAHRGCHNEKIPENSMSAFKECLKKGTPFEFDVHILKDGNVIVFHDDNLIRMTGKNKKINECTLEDLKHVYLLNSNEKIPLFKDVLNLVNGKVMLDIELKFDHKKYLLEDEVIKLLKDYKGDVILKSFDYKTVNYLKKNTNYKVGLLFPNIDNPKYGYNKLKKFLIRNTNFNYIIKPDFIACQKTALNDKPIKKYKKSGKPVIVWTIKSKEELKKYKDGADSYILENII
ncbi:MAG: glycerophosphodiester phosphodiesterase family protein [Bacilli bacterium]